ncbi:hypothetical protein QBC41DRAFT_387261 [Cercophora samala]|uniref:Uncharacterized protein n=1 Tax=Cercophora samala TaxID=330535 RepID=A0AA39ZH96_9PEZI|nr:hypothetical protein QBC41DRAFT_387261 [Cercophora samala]
MSAPCTPPTTKIIHPIHAFTSRSYHTLVSINKSSINSINNPTVHNPFDTNTTTPPPPHLPLFPNSPTSLPTTTTTTTSYHVPHRQSPTHHRRNKRHRPRHRPPRSLPRRLHRLLPPLPQQQPNSLRNRHPIRWPLPHPSHPSRRLQARRNRQTHPSCRAKVWQNRHRRPQCRNNGHGRPRQRNRRLLRRPLQPQRQGRAVPSAKGPSSFSGSRRKSNLHLDRSQHREWGKSGLSHLRGDKGGHRPNDTGSVQGFGQEEYHCQCCCTRANRDGLVL